MNEPTRFINVLLLDGTIIETNGTKVDSHGERYLTVRDEDDKHIASFVIDNVAGFNYRENKPATVVHSLSHGSYQVYGTTDYRNNV